MIKIPVYQNKSSKFRQEILLGGTTIELTLRWNVRCGCWFLDIQDVQRGENINNIKLVIDWLLLRQYKAAVPNFDGDFLVKAVDTTDTEITYDNLGSGMDLFYVTDSEGDDWENFNGVG